MGGLDQKQSRNGVGATLATALESQREWATVAAARVRFAGSAGALALICGLAVTVDPSVWRMLAAPVALHTLAAAMFRFLVPKPVAASTAGLMAILDLAMAAVIHFEAQRLSQLPLTVAAFALAFFVLLLVLNGQTLRPRAVWITGTVAAVLESWLIVEAGGHADLVLLALAVIGAAVALSLNAARATGRLVENVVDAELARLGERHRVDELEAAQRTIEQMLAEARDRSLRLESLQRDRDNLTHLLVHDLRSPLTAVIGNIDWIHESLKESGPPMLVEASGEALDRAQRLTSMISDILDVAKLEEGKLSPRLQRVRAATVLSEVREQARRSARGQSLSFEVEASEQLELEADGELVRRMLENLVSNGLRFARKRIRLSARRSGRSVELRVQNDGPSIATSARERLFEKFGQGSIDSIGWGLGLYFCRLAAEVHGGGIEVVDDLEWNVSFVVRLPESPPRVLAA